MDCACNFPGIEERDRSLCFSTFSSIEIRHVFSAPSLQSNRFFIFHTVADPECFHPLPLVATLQLQVLTQPDFQKLLDQKVGGTPPWRKWAELPLEKVGTHAYLLLKPPLSNRRSATAIDTLKGNCGQFFPPKGHCQLAMGP